MYTMTDFKRIVITGPGATAFARILSFAHSNAKFLVNWFSAPGKMIYIYIYSYRFFFFFFEQVYTHIDVIFCVSFSNCIKLESHHSYGKWRNWKHTFRSCINRNNGNSFYTCNWRNKHYAPVTRLL